MNRNKGRQVFDGEVQTGAGYIRRQTWTNPAAASTTGVHASIVLLAGTQTVTTGITNPSPARIVTITPTKAGGAAITGNVVITGTDIRGNTITDTIACGADTVTVLGVKAFKTVTSIALPARQSADDAIVIGTGSALGLDRLMVADEYINGSVDGVFETTRATVTASATDISRNKVTFNTALANTKTYRAVYVTTEKTSQTATTS